MDRCGRPLTRPRISVSMCERREQGVATVLALGWIAVVSTVGWIALLVAAVTAAQHRVDGVADLAALGAAQAAQEGSATPCDVAAHVAARSGAIVRSCERVGTDVVVTIDTELDLPWSRGRSLTSTARAGP